MAALTLVKARQEHVRLSLVLAEHDRAYYDDDAPTISDGEYDGLRKRIGELETAFPELVSTQSPLARVGAKPSGKFAKVQHRVPMLSLANGFSDEDVMDFIGRIRRFLNFDEAAP